MDSKQGDNAMIKTVRAVLKMIMLIPLVVLWDVSYFVVKKLYEGMTVVDKKGEEVIERFLNER
tara:strand:- start:242 stop:430 length:189 start_codon:yes stop_codon:yes gene_type:complete